MLPLSLSDPEYKIPISPNVVVKFSATPFAHILCHITAHLWHFPLFYDPNAFTSKLKRLYYELIVHLHCQSKILFDKRKPERPNPRDPEESAHTQKRRKCRGFIVLLYTEFYIFVVTVVALDMWLRSLLSRSEDMAICATSTGLGTLFAL